MLACEAGGPLSRRIKWFAVLLGLLSALGCSDTGRGDAPADLPDASERTGSFGILVAAVQGDRKPACHSVSAPFVGRTFAALPSKDSEHA